MPKNIVLNHTLKEYEKKYRNLNYKLLRFSKKEVEDFDKENSSKEKNYLLKGRKWWLIEDTYYEIPKTLRWTWFRNLSGAAQGVISLGLVAIIGGSISAAVLLNTNKPQPGPEPTPEKTEDEKNVDKLNEVLKTEEHQTFTTPYDAVMYMKNNNEVSIDELECKDTSLEYAYNLKNNEMVLLNKEDGKVKYAKTEVEKKSDVWKFKNKYEKTTLSNDETYGTYLKKGAINYLNNKSKNSFKNDDVEIKFNSNVDVGENRNYILIFEASETIAISEVPMVVTNYSDLTIKGSLDSVNHYGHASSLTLELNGTKTTNIYNEFGTIDGDVSIKNGNFVAAENSNVNTIVITGDNVKITISDNTSKVGTICMYGDEVSEEKKIEDFVNVIPGVEPAVSPELKDEKIKEGEKKYSGGFGTKNSPYVISTTDDLKTFSSNVNNKLESDQDMYYIQNKDITFNGEELFTPIGHLNVNFEADKSVPFKGVYDGNNLNINNLKIRQDTTSEDTKKLNSALFGYILSDSEIIFNQPSDIWDFDNREIKENKNNITSNYKTVVKNINLYNVDIESPKKYCAGIAGFVENAYVYNSHVMSGSIKGYKTEGGIAGDVLNGIVEKCSTGSNLLVDASNYNVAGISGTLNYSSCSTQIASAIIDCENNAKVISHNEDDKGGGSSGISAMIQNGPCNNLILNCTNNGYITTDSNTIEASTVSGISSNNIATAVIANCVNTGFIEIPENFEANEASGISAYYYNYMYNCHNKGNVSGKVKVGIAGVYEYNIGDTICGTVIRCSNSGTITSLNPDVTPSDLISKFSKMVVEDITCDTVTELNKMITSGVGNAELEFKNIKSVNKDVPYILRPGIGYFKSNSNEFADNISFVKSETKQSVTIEVDDFNMVINEDYSNVSVKLVGKNSSLTISENGKLAEAYVNGENAQLINNGTVLGGIGLLGNSTYLENNGTCSSLTFGHTEGGYGNKKAINRGIISRKKEGANNHVINLIKHDDLKCNIEFHNYGTIEFINDSSVEGVSGYLYSMHTISEGSIKMFHYSGSVNKQTVENFYLSISPKPEVHYSKNAKFMCNDTEIGWESRRGECGSLEMDLPE